MPSFTQFLEEDLNYDLLEVVKEIKKVRKGRYSKTECIRDIVRVVLKDKEKIINDIINLDSSSMISTEEE